MVELRKRKAPAQPTSPPAPKRNPNPIKKAFDKAKETLVDLPVQATNGTGKLAAGDTISLDGFGGEVETNTGEKTNLKKLLDDSKAGVVLFTYPKASTPGCEFYFGSVFAQLCYGVNSQLPVFVCVAFRYDNFEFLAARGTEKKLFSAICIYIQDCHQL